MHIVYGLGNPGPEYSGQRHNAGRMLVERLAYRQSISIDRDRKGVRYGEGTLENKSCALAYPTTYMNESGVGYGQLREQFDASPEHTLVVLDDLDLEPGSIRMRPSGSDGGHRGLRSILDTVDARDVPRLRIGIGRPPGNIRPSDYVLQTVTGAEREELDDAIDTGISAIETWLDEGMTTAMNQHNS